MKKSSSDTKVKKTLLRNYQLKVNPSNLQVLHDVACSSNMTQKSSRSSEKENNLDQPSLCSSEAIANYITDVKKTVPSSEDLNVDKGKRSLKITKKLNFHFNDRIYNNLIELNTNIVDAKNKKEQKPTSRTILKKDLEPNIEDFYDDEKETDFPPNIPILKNNFHPIKKVENGRLHKIVAAFEDL